MPVLEQIAARIAREVWIVAPEHDQNRQSHAFSMHHALRVNECGARVSAPQAPAVATS